MINIKVIATSALAIMAAVVFLSLVGYISLRDTNLLSFAKSIGSFVLIAIIVVTAIINAPRIIRLFT